MQRGAVAAGHRVSAQAAVDVLSNGGNAYDAVTAGFFAACVAEPVLTSLGGGGFAMVRTAHGQPRVYDCFCQTPLKPQAAADLDFHAIEADFGTARQAFHIGTGAVATPGIVAGLFELHADLGRMPMTEIVQPALAAAKQGVTVTEFQAYVLNVVRAIYTHEPASRALFASPRRGGQLLQVGDHFRNPVLADVIDALAHEGAGLFYHGEIARRILAQTENGGHLHAADLAQYRVQRHQPLLRDYAGWRVALNPPPASGGLLVALGLALLKDRPLPEEPAAHAGLIAEVLRATHQARVAIEAQGELDENSLLDPQLLAEYRNQVARRLPALRGTTHLSVLDADGNAAALTVSNGEGCGQLLPDCGFMLNNMLGEDDLNPKGFHNWPANRRLTSMMCPGIAAHPDGEVLVFGSGGSNRIRSAILQVLVNRLGLEMPLADAVEAPRLHVEGDHLSLEGGHPASVTEQLGDSFAELNCWDDRNLFFGGVHTVSRMRSGLDGHGDSRRDGVCLFA